ncbi:MAG: hypothetical protein VYA30_11205 [Myxococcota bacterium]|nr:hypothetical protein [Myxococcota bacterium]
MLRLSCLCFVLLACPGMAAAQECGPSQQIISWSQPNNVPIESDDAPRWPTDASIRLAYSGPWCPDPAQIEMQDEDGTVVPAQVRVKTPFKLVPNGPDPLTIIEIDPIAELEGRKDYQVIVRPPDPALSIFREYTLEFRTKGGPSDDLGDFEGIREARLNDDRCIEAGAFFELDDTNPICPVPNRIYASIDFQPLNRSDVAYVIYRTSSTPIATLDNPETEPPDLTPVPVAYENGARDLLGTGVPLRSSRMFLPYYPLPRRDCFAVMALDEWGRERGDLTNESCISLEVFLPCPDGCDPNVMMCQKVFPDPNPFEGGPPIPGQQCDFIGINGGDANQAIPEISDETTGDGGVRLSDGGIPQSDGGAAAGGGDGGSSGGCSLVSAADNPTKSTYFWMGVLVILGGLRQTRFR